MEGKPAHLLAFEEGTIVKVREPPKDSTLKLYQLQYKDRDVEGAAYLTSAILPI